MQAVTLKEETIKFVISLQNKTKISNTDVNLLIILQWKVNSISILIFMYSYIFD